MGLINHHGPELAAVILLFGAAVASTARAEVTTDTARERLLEAIRRAPDPAPLRGFRFEWLETENQPLTDSEYSELRRAVSGRPDHPRATVLRNAEWDRAQGSRTFVYETWFIDPSLWRSNSTTLSGMPGAAPGTFTDDARGRVAQWMYSPVVLALAPAQDGERMLSLTPALNRSFGRIKQFTSGGLFWLSLGVGNDPGIDVRVRPEAGFVASVYTRPELVWTVEFLVLPSGAVRVLKLSPPMPKNPDPDGWQQWGTLRFGDWMDEPLLGIEVARKNWIESQGRSIVSELRNVRPCTESEVETLTVEPAPDRHDPVRGAFATSTITDFRTGQSSRLNKTGTVEKTWAAPVRPGAKERTPRWIGWAAGSGVVVMVAIAVWLRNRRLA